MTTTYTPNKSLAKMNLNDLPAQWGVPVNANTGIIDASFGGITVVPVSASNVFLSSSQYQNQFIQFTGALSANIGVVFPPIGSFYTIINDTSGSSAFYITALTTVGGSRVIGIPTGSMSDIMTDGSNVRFRNLPPAGSYWDYGGSSTPAWVSGCTIPPWLYCNGTTFSSATYPALANICGGTTLPDYRGRQSFTYNDGTSRITSTSAGINGDALFASGGNQSMTLLQTHLPNTTWNTSDAGHNHTQATDNANTGFAGNNAFASGGGLVGANSGASISIVANGTGVTVNSGGSNTPFSLLTPTAVTGIRMVRAA